MNHIMTAPFNIQANAGKQIVIVCLTFSEENIRRFPKEGGALLSAPGHPKGASRTRYKTFI